MFHMLGMQCVATLAADTVGMLQELLRLSSTLLGVSESLNATSFALELAR
jgi:hypothetical protein